MKQILRRPRSMYIFFIGGRNASLTLPEAFDPLLPCEARSFLLETSWARDALSPDASALSSDTALEAATSAA